MGGYWSYGIHVYHMMPTKSFQEYTHGQSTVTEHEAQEGILQDIVGEWNERSPLVAIINKKKLIFLFWEA